MCMKIAHTVRLVSGNNKVSHDKLAARERKRHKLTTWVFLEHLEHGTLSKTELCLRIFVGCHCIVGPQPHGSSDARVSSWINRNCHCNKQCLLWVQQIQYSGTSE